MADLTTQYMGLALRNPVIVGSSGLCASVPSIQHLEQNGAGAVVLKSLFEEQILIETDQLHSDGSEHPEAADYLGHYVKEDRLRQYLDLISGAKAGASIPIIASVNCITGSNWVDFARRIEDAGADALELNVMILPCDPQMQGDVNERVCFQVVERVMEHVSIPVALKLSHYFSNLANLLLRLSRTGIAALVLFNRFYQLDIDIDAQQPKPGDPFSTPQDMAMTLRWIAIASGMVECDLAATTGIHDGEALTKQLLAGANAVQIVSSIYRDSPAVIGTMLDDLSAWMARHRYESIGDFRGKLSQSHVAHPAFYERVQFLKHFGET